MKFIGRHEELARLRRKLSSDRSESILVYGRRRVGKSELIREAIRGEDCLAVQYVCRKASYEENFSGLARAAAEALGEPFLSFRDLASLLEFLYRRARTQRIVLFIDEYPFLRDGNESVDSEFQIAIDRWQHESRLKVILCGSYMDTMQKIIEGNAPLFGRFSEILKLAPFDYYDAGQFFPNPTHEENFFLYSVLGGIPFYLLQVRENLTPEENLEELLIPEGSLLENEIRLQLALELSKEENANYVLEKIAAGIGKYSDIAENFPGKSSNAVGHTLEKLLGMDLIEKDSPINAPANKRLQRYVISDALLDLYYSYLFRESTARSVLPAREFYRLKLKERIETEYLPRRFEVAAREFLVRRNREGKMEPPFFRVGRFVWNDRKRHLNGEFDCVTEDEKGLISYECKYRKKPLDMAVVREEEEQARKLGLGFRRFGFFSRSGFFGVDPSIYPSFTLDDMYRAEDEP